MGERTEALILVCLLCALSSCAIDAKKTHYYDFVLENKNFTRMCTDKSMLVVNGSFPGPVIRVQKGDTAYVTVHNKGTYNVTIHWHGVMQPRYPWSDGPEYITQCPIPVGTSFTQKVIFSEEEGTLWWHAHSDWTRATIHGAIIIEPADRTTYPFKMPDGEEIIVLADWFDEDVMTVMDTGLITGSAFTESTAFLINGLPGALYNCTASDNTTHVENSTRIKVEHGKTYLFRIINAIMNDEMFFGIANHTMTVVGMDGAYLKPFHTKYVMITPGQTMDVLVTASHKRSLYYMAAKSFSDSMAPSPDGTTVAIIEYIGNYTAPSTPYSPDLPVKANTSAAGNFTARLRSVANKTYPVNVPKEKDLNRRIFITAAVGQNPCTTPGCVGNNNNSMRNMASLNNISIVLPSISYLQAYYGKIAGVYNATFPNTSAVVYDWTGAIAQNYSSSATTTEANLIAYGSAVEIIFQGTNSGAPENHPMHLHGQSFYVVGMGYGNYMLASRDTFNERDPPYLNTIGVPTNGWAAIRFWAKNPGVWFMHCHLEKHVSWGMGAVFITLNGNTPKTSMLPPPKYMPPCR